MTGETRPDGMTAPVHLRLAGVALALSLAGCASASAATSAATDAATSAAGDALKAAGVPTDLSVDNVTGGVKLSHLTTYDPKDPLQAYNRVMFAFNERADQYALKPVAKAYRFITPKPVQFVVGNFFSNLGDLWTGFNNLLQGKGKAAASDTARFFVNSTLGFLGFADVATEMGLEKHNEDLGQTLGWWGVPSGPYFVIPLLGPSTIRDATSRLVDVYGQPYMWQDGHEALKWSLWTVDKVHTRASLLDAEGALNDAALDKYTLMRGWPAVATRCMTAIRRMRTMRPIPTVMTRIRTTPMPTIRRRTNRTAAPPMTHPPRVRPTRRLMRLPMFRTRRLMWSTR